MNNVHFFMPISKVEKTDDGARIVHGYASTETLDLDGEIVSKAAIEKALPDYMEWGNIRQMHQAIAIGTAKEANVDDKGLYLTSRIVEPNAIKLVDEGVLKGYSIGGKKLAKSGSTITELQLIEISLVDRPANPDCKIEVAKAAGGVTRTIAFEGVTLDRADIGFFGRLLSKLSGSVGEVLPLRPLDLPMPMLKREVSDKERKTDAENGEAMPDGSFPIKTKSDLENAIKAHGRAKNKAAAKRHIIRRARALGATDSLPDGWTSKKLAKGIADLYTVSNLISLLAQLECTEERLENGGSDGHCYFAYGSTQVAVSKELTDRFGSILVDFGDIVAELLDAILSAMGDEERAEAEAGGMIEASAGADVTKAIFAELEAMAKRARPKVKRSHGDSVNKLKELLS